MAGTSSAAAARAYLELTKPGITLFIGLTAAAGYVTAGEGRGPLLPLALVTAAAMLMSGGAATLNQVHERGWDRLMRRTAGRPLPAGTLSARAAATFGWGLSAVGLAVSLLSLPLSTTCWLGLCHVSYVQLYTPLKRRTPLCTLTGAIPGAVPVLAGWTATGVPLNTAAFALTGLLFMWQIPHFLAIGWLAREDYRAAGCPMLAVVDTSGRASARVSLVYAVGMVACTGVVAASTGRGAVYLAAAALTGGAYVWFAWRFVRGPESAAPRQLFLSSLLVLPILLGALVTDIAIG